MSDHDDGDESEASHLSERTRVRKLLKNTCRRASRSPTYCGEAMVQELTRALVIIASLHDYTWPEILTTLVLTTDDLNHVEEPISNKAAN